VLQPFLDDTRWNGPKPGELHLHIKYDIMVLEADKKIGSTFFNNKGKYHASD
jgi:hypothetical protein